MAITNSMVTPSEQVDHVWHLHLSWDTEHYRECSLLITDRVLSHMPTLGGNKEGLKWDDYYGNTLTFYRAVFRGVDPPAQLWETPE